MIIIIVQTEINNGTDQTAQLCRLICTFAVPIQEEQFCYGWALLGENAVFLNVFFSLLVSFI